MRSVSDADQDRSGYLFSADEGAAPDRLAEQLEEIEKEREELAKLMKDVYI